MSGENWATKHNNGIRLGFPSGATDSLRIVWDKSTNRDVAYVVPAGDGDRGNAHAALIAAAPDMRAALQAILSAGAADWLPSPVRADARQALLKAMGLVPVSRDPEPVRAAAVPAFESLAELDPRLAALYREAERVVDDGGESFCANRIWYSRFKPRVERLVGVERDEGPEVLQTFAAHQAAAHAIYLALPDCRNCPCG